MGPRLSNFSLIKDWRAVYSRVNRRENVAVAMRKGFGPKSITEVERRIAAKLRRLRGERGLTLAELANLLTVSPQQVQKYEEGDNRLSVGRFLEFAAAYGIEPAALLDGELPSAEPAFPRMALGVAKHFAAIRDRAVAAAVARLVARLAGSEIEESAL